MTERLGPAPFWDVEQWLNSDRPLDVPMLRGRVVLLGAFQMLCPGCVEHSIPQLKRVHALFRPEDVAVIGLHTVFEHHDAIGATGLRAFLHEYRVAFPVGIDRAGEKGQAAPATMRSYEMQGTPTTILIDREGQLRRQTFGHLPDLQLGAEIMSLAHEASASTLTEIGRSPSGARCELGGGAC